MCVLMSACTEGYGTEKLCGNSGGATYLHLHSPLTGVAFALVFVTELLQGLAVQELAERDRLALRTVHSSCGLFFWKAFFIDWESP